MLFLLWGILILLGIIFPKSKVVSVLIISFMIIAIGFRTQGPDYVGYQNEFKYSVFQTMNTVYYKGYVLLEQYAGTLGITFEKFVIIVGSISILLLYFSINKIVENVNIVMSFFMIYPFSHEAIQMRTFLGDTVLLFSFLGLIKILPEFSDEDVGVKKAKIYRFLLFYFGAILACSFHFVETLYVLFISLLLFFSKKFGRVYIFSRTIFIFLLIETEILPRLVEPLNGRIAFWLSGKTGVGIIFPIFITLMIWYAMQVFGKYCIELAKKDRNEVVVYQELLRFSDYIILIIPLFCYDITFNRLWRLFLIVLYIFVARIMTKKIKKKILFEILFLLSIIFIVVCIYENIFTIMYGFFEKNAIFKDWSLL